MRCYNKLKAEKREALKTFRRTENMSINDILDTISHLDDFDVSTREGFDEYIQFLYIKCTYALLMYEPFKKLLHEKDNIGMYCFLTDTCNVAKACYNLLKLKGLDII